jgi:hypothetical protein
MFQVAGWESDRLRLHWSAVLTFVAVTSTPGISAPVGSETLPPILALTCAELSPGTEEKSTISVAAMDKTFLIHICFSSPSSQNRTAEPWTTGGMLPQYVGLPNVSFRASLPKS